MEGHKFFGGESVEAPKPVESVEGKEITVAELLAELDEISKKMQETNELSKDAYTLLEKVKALNPEKFKLYEKALRQKRRLLEGQKANRDIAEKMLMRWEHGDVRDDDAIPKTEVDPRDLPN